MNLPHVIKVIRQKPKLISISADLITCPDCNPDNRLDLKFFLEIIKNPSKLPHKVEVRWASGLKS